MDATKYIYVLIMFIVFGLATCQAQFFKYATFYTSMSMNTSMIEDEDFIAINKGYEETTQINEYDYNFTIGIRKISRFDFEQKNRTWYT
jgi:phage anti-repressor protein